MYPTGQRPFLDRERRRAVPQGGRGGGERTGGVQEGHRGGERPDVAGRGRRRHGFKHAKVGQRGGVLARAAGAQEVHRQAHQHRDRAAGAHQEPRPGRVLRPGGGLTRG